MSERITWGLILIFLKLLIQKGSSTSETQKKLVMRLNSLANPLQGHLYQQARAKSQAWQWGAPLGTTGTCIVAAGTVARHGAEMPAG